MYTLTCNVSAISGLMNSPSAVWTDGTMNISDGSGVTVSTTTASSYSISVLTFDPLKTSHGGVYTCVGAVGSPALYSPQTDSMEETVTVQSELIICYQIALFTLFLSLYFWMSCTSKKNNG